MIKDFNKIKRCVTITYISGEKNFSEKVKDFIFSTHTVDAFKTSVKTTPLNLLYIEYTASEVESDYIISEICNIAKELNIPNSFFNIYYMKTEY